MNGGNYSAPLCEERHRKLDMELCTLNKLNRADHSDLFDQLHKMDMKLTKVAVFASIGSLLLGGFVGAFLHKLL